LGIKNLSQMEKWMYKLNSLNVDYTTWREPDINNEVTAIASTSKNGIFRKLNLL